MGARMSNGELYFDLDCKNKMLKPELQYRFHPVRKWKFDFAFPAIKLAVEIEGGTWINGRHSRGSGFTKDCEKYNAAVKLGWRVLRYTTAMVENGAAINEVVEYIEAL